MPQKQQRAFATAVLLLAFIALCFAAVFTAINVSDLILPERAAARATPALEDPLAGLLVTAVRPGSPAAQAGLLPGHIILSADGISVNTPQTLQQHVEGRASGMSITLIVLVDGEQRQAQVARGSEPPYLGIEVIPRREADAATALPASAPSLFEEATPDPAHVGLAVVAAVLPGTPAEAVGLQAGDVITAVDGAAILSTAELVDAIAAKAPGEAVTLTLRRGTDTLTRTVNLTTHPNDANRAYLGVEVEPTVPER